MYNIDISCVSHVHVACESKIARVKFGGEGEGGDFIDRIGLLSVLSLRKVTPLYSLPVSTF